MAGFTIDTSGPARPEMHAVRVQGEVPVVDGRLDDAGWARAAAVTFDTDYAGAKTSIPTRARILWSAPQTLA